MNPFAKSSFHVIVQREVPSPCTMTGLPSIMRLRTCQLPFFPCTPTGTERSQYVWLGRTMVTGNPSSRYAFIRRDSHAILLREYSQYGFARVVPSVMTCWRTGLLYAEAELMNTYCLVRPENILMSRADCSGMNPMNSHTESNVSSPSLTMTSSGCSLISPVISLTFCGKSELRLPRLSNHRSFPSAASCLVMALLIVPVPPIISIFIICPPSFHGECYGILRIFD